VCVCLCVCVCVCVLFARTTLCLQKCGARDVCEDGLGFRVSGLVVVDVMYEKIVYCIS